MTYYECHGHSLMDGADFRAARERHSHGVDETAVRAQLAALRAAGVVYFRDGGDAHGVGLFARGIAADYGIDYVTPAFAIHRRGRYGSIVGRGYETRAEYQQLLLEARRQHCDFIKVMLSGIITFQRYGELSCAPLDREEIRWLIADAHELGFAVMAHVNGAETIYAAVEAGLDSVDHGFFLDERCLAAMAERGTFWVPTIAAAAAFIGRAGFDDAVARATTETQQRMAQKALERGVLLCPGSDSGAVGVPHGAGILAEYELLGGEASVLNHNARLLAERFRPQIA
ncbi:MAG: amidohydrolase family protein [Oscillospiraceae bacterium]|nr:amidohydrolase family protein [Oscillospiraceae bacterium]